MSFDLTTVAGLAAATVVIVQILLTAAALPDAIQNRWGPIIAIAVAIGLSLVHVATSGTAVSTNDVVNAVLLGVAAGASAMGIHNVATKSVVGSTVTSALGINGSTSP